MAIRIERLKINQGGPLDGDLEFQAGGLNLIYGPNESGKTYVVETMVNLLFKTGERAPVSWQLRDWDLSGRAVVSGLDETSLNFMKTSKKMEDYWEQAVADLPPDLSRMLVVRAGETALADSADGFTRAILKDYLSGGELLDAIDARISATIQSATLENGTITGNRRGEVKKCQDLLGERSRLDELLEEVNRGVDFGKIQSWKNAIEQKKEAVQKLLVAKRCFAGQLNGKLQTSNTRLQMLPDERDCQKIGKQIALFRDKEATRKTQEQELAKLESKSEDFSWIEKALANYEEIMSKQSTQRRSPVFLVLAAVFFIVAIAAGLFSHKWELGIGAAVTLFFAWLHLTEKAKIRNKTAGATAELKKLEEEFQKRFDRPLTDKAVIQTQQEALRKNHVLAEQLREQQASSKHEVVSMEQSINHAFLEYGQLDLSSDRWEEELAQLVESRISTENEMHGCERQIASVSIPPDQYLVHDPGIEWDAERCAALEEAVTFLGDELKAADNAQEVLKSRVAQRTSHHATASWEALLGALQEERERVSTEYKQITAEILGKSVVHAALREFRAEESERIREGLTKPELTESLKAITGRYESIDLEDKDLVLSDVDGNSFPLQMLSTGAKEQVFMALRLGFAAIGLKGEPAFLILDDAFQHSDWVRRGHLVDQILRVIRSGWQVFYFTMDNHIRDLFKAAGNEIEADFKYTELS